MILNEKCNSLPYLGGFQVVHWDRQSPGVHHDRADRLVDLYASGEQRSYGPLFLQRKMNISNHAFSEGDFSLAISDLQVCERRVAQQKTPQEPDSKNKLEWQEVHFPLGSLSLCAPMHFG